MGRDESVQTLTRLCHGLRILSVRNKTVTSRGLSVVAVTVTGFPSGMWVYRDGIPGGGWRDGRGSRRVDGYPTWRAQSKETNDEPCIQQIIGRRDWSSRVTRESDHDPTTILGTTPDRVRELAGRGSYGWRSWRFVGTLTNVPTKEEKVPKDDKMTSY